MVSSEQRLVAIVGHAGDKFYEPSEDKARWLIREILAPNLFEEVVLVSGGCHQGGVDIFAEEEAKSLGLATLIFKPKNLMWSTGFKPRNIQIAKACTEAHCIVVADYPPGYTTDDKGLKFPTCYHCGMGQQPHIKSGGCWTVKRAGSDGKPTFWHII